MAERAPADLPCVVLFNINGSGMGHLSTCLAYARRLEGRARPVFFSLASAIDVIHDFGFEADYFVSRFWSRASSWAWDQQLALRLGLLFERVRPQVVVFDGTWPYRGLLHAAAAYGKTKLVWSNLVLYKPSMHEVPVRESHFDLIIRLGEIGAAFSVDKAARPGRTVTIPPCTLLDDAELLDRDRARDALGLTKDRRYALFSLGPGNLKDVGAIGRGLFDELTAKGYEVAWARAPISLHDVDLPPAAIPLTLYPLARYLRAFDVVVSAAGYNSCCEVLQSRVPTLFVPNTLVADDQVRRAELVATKVPAVVSACESADERRRAVEAVLEVVAQPPSARSVFDLDGADKAADEIVALLDGREG